MKNHINVGNKTLQTNKKWSQLKKTQKEWIYNIIKIEYFDFITKNNKIPNKQEKEHLLDIVYEKIQERKIWIPYNEVKKIFNKKTTKFKKDNFDLYIK